MSAELRESEEASARAEKRRNIETILPLLPMQKALLYAAVNARDPADDPGLIQVRFTVEGHLDVESLRQAWSAVVHRYAALRMAVRSAPGKDPLVVVWKRIDPPWQFHDWSQLDEAAFERRKQDYLVDDRQCGLSVQDVPVMRFAVLQRSEHHHDIVWTCHHLLLDGWSSAIVVNELIGACGALMQGHTPNVAPGRSDYRDYMAWWRSCDADASKRYWRQLLEGTEPLALIGGPRSRGSREGARASIAECEVALGPVLSGRLLAACQQHRVTSNALILGAWGLMLSALYQRGDVLFGTTVAGRPAILPDAESLVGMFVNNIPVCIDVNTETNLGDWLQKIRNTQMEAAGHVDLGLDEIQSELGLPISQPMFETLIVVENYPWTGRDSRQKPRLGDYRSGLMSTYPLTLAVIPDDDWQVTLTFDQRYLDDETAGDLLGLLGRVFGEMLAGMAAPTVETRDRLAAEPLVPTLSQRLALHSVEQDLRDDLVDTALEAFVPPQTETQLRLVAIWEEVLGVRPVSIDDDFFALGGNSMAAMRLFARIEQRLQRKLPLTALLERPTVLALSELLENDAEFRWRSLIPIRAAGDRPPLFCVHAGGEHVLYYRHLVRRLAAGRPVFGLQPPGLDGEDEPLWRIEEIASRYVDELRQVQPQGPYTLLGYCIGASVCLEMARELEALDERVDRLIVLDSGFWWGPEPAVSVQDHDDGKPRTVNVLRKIGRVARRDGLGLLVQLLVRNVALIWERSSHAARQKLSLRFGSAEVRREVWRGRVDTASVHAFRHYVPRPCRAPAVLVRTTEYMALEEKERHLRWQEVTGGLDLRVVDGEHQSLLNEPMVAQVAEIVDEILAAPDRAPLGKG